MKKKQQKKMLLLASKFYFEKQTKEHCGDTLMVQYSGIQYKGEEYIFEMNISLKKVD